MEIACTVILGEERTYRLAISSPSWHSGARSRARTGAAGWSLLQADCAQDLLHEWRGREKVAR
jgi:hypothetical protein